MKGYCEFIVITILPSVAPGALGCVTTEVFCPSAQTIHEPSLIVAPGSKLTAAYPFAQGQVHGKLSLPLSFISG